MILPKDKVNKPDAPPEGDGDLVSASLGYLSFFSFWVNWQNNSATIRETLRPNKPNLP